MSDLKRVPFQVTHASRFEQGAFLCLGLAALVLVAFTIADGARFSAGREQIISGLVKPVSTTLAGPGKNAATNLTIFQQGGADERSRLNQFPVPKS
jgi:hypothetical protein